MSQVMIGVRRVGLSSLSGIMEFVNSGGSSIPALPW